MIRNRLAQETSPYLLQHKDHPVHWQPWDEQAFSEARASNKPILLSVGYAACHWCHVMAHESFENPETARVMNELCVNIKVDREERPDIDFLYQHALALLGEQGGWPLTMLLTPRGVPLWGGTYFPPEPSFGRRALRDFISGVVDYYYRQPQHVRHGTIAMQQALQHLSKTGEGDGPSLSLLDQAARDFIRHLDQIHGGLQGTPKFPQFLLFGFLWRAWRRTRDKRFMKIIHLTIKKICHGGIYDHLGGGLARYSTDEVWLVPHFEKMLYDNALFVDLLTTIWQDTHQPLFARRIEETVAWVVREMIAEPGAFAASLDADSAGKEGRFYVWSKDEIDTVLGCHTALFCNAYGVTTDGQWEGYNILHRCSSVESEDFTIEESLRTCRTRLLSVRAARVQPARDDKILADWNGLMIQALARAGMVFAQPTWIALAGQAFATVCTHMTLPGDRLGHSLCLKRLQATAMLEDYANMSLAALSLLEATADPKYLEYAKRWVATVERLYWDEHSGGYFFTAKETTNLITPIKTATDNAVPAGNGTMAWVLARLYHITGIETYRKRVEILCRIFTSHHNHLAHIATLMNAFEYLHTATLVVVVGPPSETESWRRHVLTAQIGGDFIVLSGPVGSPLVQERPMVHGRVTAYICRGKSCSAPVTTLDMLKEALSASCAVSR